MSVRSLIPRAPAQTSRPLASIATLSTIANPRLVFSSPHKDEVSLARRTMLRECPCTLRGASSGGEVAMMTPRVMVVLTAACGPQPGQHQDSNEGRHHRTLAVEEEGTICRCPRPPHSLTAHAPSHLRRTLCRSASVSFLPRSMWYVTCIASIESPRLTTPSLPRLSDRPLDSSSWLPSHSPRCPTPRVLALHTQFKRAWARQASLSRVRPRTSLESSSLDSVVRDPRVVLVRGITWHPRILRAEAIVCGSWGLLDGSWTRRTAGHKGERDVRQGGGDARRACESAGTSHPLSLLVSYLG